MDSTTTRQFTGLHLGEAHVSLLGNLLLVLLSAQTHDLDRDKIPDEVESALLARFEPTFHLDKSECAGRPAQFHAEHRDPLPGLADGTIYGQVFPAGPGLVEIHYYHLWRNDCGRAGHALDAEHVSVLVSIPDWNSERARALYWYSAAHEDTPCDVSSAAKAAALGSDTGGINVWISRGKHASFLSQETCGGGCGGDRCDNSVRLKPAKLINLGEATVPFACCPWVQSSRWPLRAKMQSDFPESLRARLAAADSSQIVRVPRNASAHALIRAGGSTGGAIDVSGRHAGNALSMAGYQSDAAVGAALENAGKATQQALAESAQGVGTSLKHTGRAVATSLRVTARFLRLSK